MRARRLRSEPLATTCPRGVATAYRHIWRTGCDSRVTCAALFSMRVQIPSLGAPSPVCLGAALRLWVRSLPPCHLLMATQQVGEPKRSWSVLRAGAMLLRWPAVTPADSCHDPAPHSAGAPSCQPRSRSRGSSSASDYRTRFGKTRARVDSATGGREYVAVALLLGVPACILGLVALVRRGERSLLVWLTVVPAAIFTAVGRSSQLVSCCSHISATPGRLSRSSGQLRATGSLWP